MSRRLVGKQFKVWDNQDSTTATSSTFTNVEQTDIIKYIIEIDPTVAGTLSVEFADEQFEKDFVWRKLDFEQVLVLNGAIDTEYEIFINFPVCKNLRLRLISNTGTGNVNAWITSTTVGA